MMQDTLLRVCVVALGLLTYLRDDPEVEEWDTITVGMQKHEERLLRGGDQLQMAPVSEEMTNSGNKSPQDDMKNIPMFSQQTLSDKHTAEKVLMSVLEDVTVTKPEEDSADHKLPVGGHRIVKLDPGRPQNSKSEPEAALKTSEQQRDMKSTLGEDIKSYGSFRSPSRPQGQQENPGEREVFSSKGQESPLAHLHTKTSENDTSEKAMSDWERDYFWYIWNTFSIISMIRYFRKYLGRSSRMKQEEPRAFPVTCTAAQVPLPDSDTLQRLHSKYIQVPSNNRWREEFLEGFANDLLDAMRTVGDRHGCLVIEDFQMDARDIVVSITPPDPYSFQYLLCDNQTCDLLPEMQVCGQIKLVQNLKIQNGCHCQSPDTDDMVCLLHCETEKVKIKIIDVCDGHLCMKNSPFLSKSHVTRWFQSTIKQAWAQISHKYEFELNISYIDAPGALVVHFRSGKKISFRMNPVVKLNTHAHFFITSCSPNNLDTLWTLSLTNYENCFLEHISIHLPENSCHSQTLELAHFLHKRQTALSGSSALKDFHFKTALMHLLLTKDPSQWKPNNVACRLRDLLDFMESSLEKRLLHHVLIGNPLTQKVIELPVEFTQTKTVNLFHPLVVHDCIYRHAVKHFQEMLRNAHMLIHDYADQCIDCANHSM